MHVARPWILPALLALTLSLVFGATLADMAHEWWTEPAASQGLILPPLAIYLAWLNQRAWHAAPAQTDRSGLALTAAGCLCFLAGNLAAEFFLMRISFVIVLAGLVLSFWGWPRLRVLSLPMLLLATMVPLPSIVYTSLAAPLQLLASDVATRVAQAVGVSVYRDGNLIQLAATTLGVAEACSGLSSLSALIVGSVLLGFLVCETATSRVLLFLSALPLAVAVNVVRVAGTAIAADYDENLALGFYHSFSGWLVFMAGFGLLYLTGRLLHRLVDPRATSTSAAAAGVAA